MTRRACRPCVGVCRRVHRHACRRARGAASFDTWRGIAGHVARHRWTCGTASLGMWCGIAICMSVHVPYEEWVCARIGWHCRRHRPSRRICSCVQTCAIDMGIRTRRTYHWQPPCRANHFESRPGLCLRNSRAVGDADIEPITNLMSWVRRAHRSYR